MPHMVLGRTQETSSMKSPKGRISLVAVFQFTKYNHEVKANFPLSGEGDCEKLKKRSKSSGYLLGSTPTNVHLAADRDFHDYRLKKSITIMV